MNLLIKYITILLYFCSGRLLISEQPTTLFCHGIVDNHTQIYRYENFIQQPQQSFDFPDAQYPIDWNINNVIFQSCDLFGKKPINREKMHMGHGPDIEKLHQQVNPEKPYILYGLSRGGATAISYLAQYNPNNVQALIIDAAPADVVASVDAFQYAIGYKFAPERSTQEAIFHTLFPAYPMNSTPAVQDIANIHNKNLPILIVHSADDNRVHISSAWQLYIAFLQAGFQHVYLCQLTTGVHAHYMEGSQAALYLQALHSFYQKHNFAYNNNYANLDLQTLQPHVEEIHEKLSNYQENLEKNYQENQAKTHLTFSALAAVFIVWLGRYNPKS